MTRFEYHGKYPDSKGKFGRFGGTYVPETLVPAITELANKYIELKDSTEFIDTLQEIREHYTGRPTPLTHARGASEDLGCQVFLKREDLLHGGAHKLNNTMGQALLAKMMGKHKLIAETGAGQHGFATAIAGAYFNMETKVFMGKVDMVRQAYNVARMRLLGAEVVPVTLGSQTLKEAVSAALRYWSAHSNDTHYLIGSVMGPHPYPMMVRDFQRVIGKEIKAQLSKRKITPNAIIACVGGGSNAMGAFYDFIEDKSVELHAVEAAGRGENSGEHALALNAGTEGILHGAREFLLQDDYGNPRESYSISAGLDYPGVGPELCFLAECGRLKLGKITDEEALEAFKYLSKREGIMPALESSHALAHAFKLAREDKASGTIVVNLSGHGGKDLDIILDKLDLENNGDHDE
ncbi:tryptophan synthase subunit beta [Candidatus Bathyarchaeota archaeon]|nr:tryptophan synthase subunit beta [Candidatus Bathyarchaeota archaeon]